jgi:hypothetical protein
MQKGVGEMRNNLKLFLERLVANEGHCHLDWYLSAGVMCGNAGYEANRDNPNICPVFKRTTGKYCLKDEACKIAQSLLWEDTVEEELSK